MKMLIANICYGVGKRMVLFAMRLSGVGALFGRDNEGYDNG